MHTIWYAYVSKMSARLLSVLPWATFSIWSCHSALAFFHALVKDVLQDMQYRIVFVYLDDILIFSRTPKEHI